MFRAQKKVIAQENVHHKFCHVDQLIHKFQINIASSACFICYRFHYRNESHSKKKI